MISRDVGELSSSIFPQAPGWFCTLLSPLSKLHIECEDCDLITN